MRLKTLIPAMAALGFLAACGGSDGGGDYDRGQSSRPTRWGVSFADEMAGEIPNFC